MLVTWGLCLICLQEPTAKPPGATQGVAAEAAAERQAVPTTPAPAVAWSDKEAKPAVDAFQKALKKATSMADKNLALDSIAAGSHKTLVKPLGAIVEHDKSILIRKRAADLLAQQPPADSKPEQLRLIRCARVQSAPSVLAALVVVLARTYQPADWPIIEPLFAAEYAEERVPLQEAILKLVTQHKEKRAMDILLDNLDEPVPANVDDAANPPAEYWEARWKAWKAWRGQVKEALFSLTGQNFSTAAEARAWLKNRRK